MSIAKVAEDLIGLRAKSVLPPIILFPIGAAMGVFARKAAGRFTAWFHPDSMLPPFFPIMVTMAERATEGRRLIPVEASSATGWGALLPAV